MSDPQNVVLTTRIPGLPRHATGKVRDVYAVGEEALLLVATDRISAFDVVLHQGIRTKAASSRSFPRTGSSERARSSRTTC
jgi:hypothetical protein